MCGVVPLCAAVCALGSWLPFCCSERFRGSVSAEFSVERFGGWCGLLAFPRRAARLAWVQQPRSLTTCRGGWVRLSGDLVAKERFRGLNRRNLVSRLKFLQTRHLVFTGFLLCVSGFFPLCAWVRALVQVPVFGAGEGVCLQHLGSLTSVLRGFILRGWGFDPQKSDFGD